MSSRILAALGMAAAVAFGGAPASAESLRDVVEKAVRTNPAVGAVEANQRATELELRQSEGRRLPRVDLEADTGAERIDRPNGFTTTVNDEWRNRRQATLTFSQVLFDGWERSNDIYRNAARVTAASFRVEARSELVALDAVEAFIDVRRHRRVIKLAEESLRAHKKILERVKEQATAGRVAQSDVVQVEERVAASEASIERIRQALLEAESKFLRVVGEVPGDLAAPGYPAGVPTSRTAAVEAGTGSSPIVAAAGADVDVARYAFEQSRAARLPQVGLEVRGVTGADLGGTPGLDQEVNARIVLRWNLFDGMITRHRELELAERLAQASAEEEERRRLVQEEIDRALAAYLAGGRRLEPLRRQLKLSSSVVSSYETEYGLAKRSLIELLDAENARFNAAMDVANTEALHVFSAYRILAAMGSLRQILGIQ